MKKPNFKVELTILPLGTSRKDWKWHPGKENVDFNIVRCGGWLKTTPNDSAYKKVDEKYTNEYDAGQICDDFISPNLPEILKGTKKMETENAILEII